MCHDGANAVPPPDDTTENATQSQETNEIEAREVSRKISFRAFMLKLMRRGYNIALINGVDFIDTKVRSYHRYLSYRLSPDRWLIGDDNGR